MAFIVDMHADGGCELTLRQDGGLLPVSASLSTQAKKGWFSTDERVWAICSLAIFQMSAGIAAAQSDGLIFTRVWTRVYA